MDRQRIGLGRQKPAAATEDNRFQMKFQGVPVHEDDRREINVRNPVAATQRSGQRFCGFMEGPSVGTEIIYWNETGSLYMPFQGRIWSWRFRVGLPPLHSAFQYLKTLDSG